MTNTDSVLVKISGKGLMVVDFSDGIVTLLQHLKILKVVILLYSIL